MLCTPTQSGDWLTDRQSEQFLVRIVTNDKPLLINWCKYGNRQQLGSGQSCGNRINGTDGEKPCIFQNDFQFNGQTAMLHAGLNMRIKSQHKELPCHYQNWKCQLQTAHSYYGFSAFVVVFLVIVHTVVVAAVFHTLQPLEMGEEGMPDPRTEGEAE